MPPKGSGRAGRQGRGAQGTRAGRGRGRGGSRAGGAASPTLADQDGALGDNGDAQTGTNSNPIEPSPTTSSEQRQQHTAEPATSSTSAATSTPAAPSHSAASGASRGGKFRPRGIRRSEAERERIVQEQDAILNQRLAEDARQRARANRFRAGRSRGRGRGRGGIISTMAAGPLSHGFASGGGSGGYAAATSYRGGSGGQGSGGMASGGKAWKGEPTDANYGISTDEFDDRINADLLYSRFELDPNNETAAHLMPMGIPRVEHKEEKVVMATAAEIEAREHGEQLDDDSDDDMWVDNPAGHKPELVKDEEVWEHAAPQPTGPVKVKTQDGSIIETMDIDEIAAGEVVHDENKPELSSNRRKARKRVVPPDPEEEYLTDVLQRNLKIFGPVDEDTHAKGEPHPREGKVFLFQFPPILPPLAVRKVEKPINPVKDEPNDDVVMLDVPHGDPASVDLTKDEDKEVKEEKVVVEDKATQFLQKQRAGREWPKTGGYLGKVLVHKSGKVTLDWGGLPMAVEAAIPISFIRTAVLVNHNDSKPNAEDPSQFDGTAYGMGRIEEKFCCAPIFTPPQPWEIDPKDLEPPNEE